LNEHLGMFTAVPLTSVINKVDGQPKDRGDFRHFRIRIQSASKKADPGQQSARIFSGDSIALPEQIRALSVDRIKDSPRIGMIDTIGLGAIEAGLLFVNGAGIRRDVIKLKQSLEPAPRKVEIPSEPAKPSPGPPPKK
ncbi:MAG TPA: hypothetical protein VEU96_02830, partial [Bryobacteraceae bacterium]|nr:hypothetical protein [Bryobacteraceae bacterium]